MAKNNPTDQIDMQQAGQEAKLLRKIRLTSLTATPKTIAPFEESTLAWKILVPADAAEIAGLRFTLGNAPVDRTGSKPVSPLQTGAFLLRAHGELTTRILGDIVVTVEAGGCQQIDIKSLQLRSQAEKLRDKFVAGSISARGDVSVESSADGLRVKVPLKIAIPNFFDADTNVVLKITFAVKNGKAVVTLDDIDVDVIFNLAEHIASLGTATFLQSAMEPLAEDLIQAFLGDQLQSELSGEVNGIIDQLLSLWQSADPQKRKFKLYSLATIIDGLTIVGCPVTEEGGISTTGKDPQGGISTR